MTFLVWLHPWRHIITFHLMKLTESSIETQYIVLRSNRWFWTAKRVGRPHKSCNFPHQVPRHSKILTLFTMMMALGWVLFCTMKTLGSYIILIVIFYQFLIRNFSFSKNIYLTMDSMIITTHLIMMFLLYIVHHTNLYFELFNPSWILNSKQQPCQFVLKRYRK